MDGVTRLGLVLHDEELISRAKEDYDAVMAAPDSFNATFKGDVVEGWVRSIYSRGMLAYYDGTGDRAVLEFLEEQLGKYRAQDSLHTNQPQTRQGSRSMTQMEALLEVRPPRSPPPSALRSAVSTARPSAELRTWERCMHTAARSSSSRRRWSSCPPRRRTAATNSCRSS